MLSVSSNAQPSPADLAVIGVTLIALGVGFAIGFEAAWFLALGGMRATLDDCERRLGWLEEDRQAERTALAAVRRQGTA